MLPVEFEVISFSISINKNIYKFEGNKITDEAYNFILKSRKKSIITIDNIEYSYLGCFPKKVEPIEIFLID